MTSTFLVIGASTGLGRSIAEHLARDRRVFVAGRSAAADVRVDLRDLSDVARAATELRAFGPFAGIVCNAGIQQTGEPDFTAAGHEETFAVNHLAHFAMVMRLAPALVPGGRVAFIGSASLDPDDFGARRFGFRGGQYTTARSLAAGEGDPAVTPAQRARDRYATSKLCNLLTVQALASRGIDAFAFDPGLMPGTGLARNYNVVMRVLWHSLLKLFALVMPGASSARRSGAALAFVLTSPELVRGAYYDFRRKPLAIPSLARRTDWAEDLYATSLDLVGIARDPFATASPGQLAL